jgi:hypothetical protein
VVINVIPGLGLPSILCAVLIAYTAELSAVRLYVVVGYVLQESKLR